mmetsp:Transcript_94118/g.304086  ORF Transcript_94118/g.304086 Transcript_94118/m.304086 type:complete len:201 (-) Transcript_94118:13-615(-)
MKCASTSAVASGAAVWPPVALASEAWCRSLASARRLPASSGVLPPMLFRKAPMALSSLMPMVLALLARLWMQAMVPQAFPTYCFRYTSLSLTVWPSASIFAFCSCLNALMLSEDLKSSVTATHVGGTMHRRSGSVPKTSTNSQGSGRPTFRAKFVSMSGLDSSGTQCTFFIFSTVPSVILRGAPRARARAGRGQPELRGA